MLAIALPRKPAGRFRVQHSASVHGRQLLNALDGLLQGRDEVDLDRVPLVSLPWKENSRTASMLSASTATNTLWFVIGT